MSEKRRKFTPEFRAEAVELVVETGRPVARVAAEIGVGAQLLGRWVQLASKDGVVGDRPLDVSERAGVGAGSARRNADLRLDRSFLKKAAVFFASDQPR